MSEDTLAIKQEQVSKETIAQKFGIQNLESIPVDVAMDLVEIITVLFGNKIDSDTAFELIRSFETNHGQSEDPKQRMQKFLNFIKSAGSKGDLIGTVKSMGLLSKAELEDHAKETGDWSLFLKRVSRDRK